MARVLKTTLQLDTVMAKRNADQVKQKLRGVGQQGKQAGGEASQGMQGAAGATAKFGTALVALGGSYAALSAVKRVIAELTRAYEQAMAARDKYASGAGATMRTVAPAAAQFGVSERDMAQLVYGIGREAGAAPQDTGAITGMITSAASAGLIGAITKGPAGQGLQIAPKDREILVALQKFAQYTGQPAMGAELAKLVRKGIPGAKTPEAVQATLGKTMQAFRLSQVSDWGEFITGAVSGGAVLLEEGVSYETVISKYAALAKMERSGVRAGETMRMIGERFFTGDDEKVIRHIDRKFGAGTYDKLKTENPDALFAMVLQELTTPEGPARRKLYKKLDIPVEQGGRLARMKGAAAEEAAIAAAMRTVTPDVAVSELDRWRAGPRATGQVAGLEAARMEFEPGATDAAARMAALRTLARKRWELEEERDPMKGFWKAIIPTTGRDEDTVRMGLSLLLEDEQKKRGEKQPYRLRRPFESITGREGVEYHEDVVPAEQQAIEDILDDLLGAQSPQPMTGPTIGPAAAEPAPQLPAQPTSGPTTRPTPTSGPSTQITAGVVINNPAVVYARTPDEMATNTATRVDQE